MRLRWKGNRTPERFADTVKLALGVRWAMTYVAKSLIPPAGSQLFLDGQLLGSLTGSL